MHITIKRQFNLEQLLQLLFSFEYINNHSNKSSKKPREFNRIKFHVPPPLIQKKLIRILVARMYHESLLVLVCAQQIKNNQFVKDACFAYVRRGHKLVALPYNVASYFAARLMASTASFRFG